MSAMPALSAMLRRARRHRAFDLAAIGLPLAVAGACIAFRLGGIGAVLAVVALGVIAGVALTARVRRTIDTRWLARRLDAARADMDDSAALLFADPATLAPLQRLQRARLQQRLDALPPPDLRPRRPTRTIALVAAFACAVVATTLLWPAREPLTVANLIARVAPPDRRPTHTRIVMQRLRIVPPRYTGRAAVEQAGLDARVPERSTLQWTLRLAPQPRSAALVFHDGRRVALARVGDAWQARHVPLRPALYRIVLDDAPPLRHSRRYRLDLVADRPPQVRVLSPERSLSLVRPGQRSWSVAFEARDDYGVDAGAELRVILAQGSGENITFRERSVRLRGGGPPTQRRFAHRFDFGALGFAAGDDLIVQLRVQDTRQPQPHAVRSASLILRWPADAGSEATGLDGMVKKVLPAYFRSQRQIIIDAEALLKDKRRLAADAYAERSDGIGVDQRLLRLRYGQFLGEETQGAPALPTNDAEPAHADDPPTAGHGAGTRTDDATPAASPAPDAHAHEPAEPSAAFGQETAVLEQFGHTHDEAEAATLLDPETRATLKAALDEMWQSELHLRQGQPERALPFAYRALGFIKKVQQASRIYLARVGPELPPIDEGRRLGGDRAGLAPRDDVLEAGPGGEPALAALWQALDDATGDAPRAVDTAPLQRWLAANPSRVDDPLAWAAALEAVQADPRCGRCRSRLRALLWPLLPRPATSVPRRSDGGPAGARYLDALRREAGR